MLLKNVDQQRIRAKICEASVGVWRAGRTLCLVVVRLVTVLNHVLQGGIGETSVEVVHIFVAQVRSRLVMAFQIELGGQVVGSVTTGCH